MENIRNFIQPFQSLILYCFDLAFQKCWKLILKEIHSQSSGFQTNFTVTDFGVFLIHELF